MRLKGILLSLLAIFAAPSISSAACTAVGTNPVILIPNFSDPGNVWAACLQYDFRILQSSGVFSSSGTNSSFGRIAVSTITGNPTGYIYLSSDTYITANLYVSGDRFSVGGSTFSVTQGTVTINRLQLNNFLAIPYGGTGAGSFNSHGIVLGGSSALGSTPAMANGGLVIGAGTGVDPATGTVSGTTNQVIVTNSPGGIGLSLPQSIASISSPTFSGLTLQNGITASSGAFASSVTASSFFGDGSHLSGISSVVSSTMPTQKNFLTAGAFVYYSTSSLGFTPRQIQITCKGGGGAGGGSIAGFASAGNDGTASSFNSVTASAGNGCSTSASGIAGAVPQSPGSGTATSRLPGAPGGPGMGAVVGGNGGGPGGGAGQTPTTAGLAGRDNSGGGGSGAGSATGSGCGGSEGETFFLIINSPSANYSGVVGAGGTIGNSTTNGGPGGSGYCRVYELYN